MKWLQDRAPHNLVSRLSSRELQWLAGQLRKAAETTLDYRWKTRVFLCGAALSQTASVRSQLQRVLEQPDQISSYEIHLPERMFRDLHLGDGEGDLLSIENALAKSVDVVLLIPESPGSLAELGAFTNHDELRKKLVVVMESKYRNNQSFIMRGPIRLMRRKSEGGVVFVDGIDPLSPPDIEKIKRELQKFSPRRSPAKGRKTIDVSKLLEASHFLLICLYAMDPLSAEDLSILLRSATGVDPADAGAFVASGLQSLLRERVVVKEANGYRLGASMNRLWDYDTDLLDAIRIEFLTSRYRAKMLNTAAENGRAS